MENNNNNVKKFDLCTYEEQENEEFLADAVKALQQTEGFEENKEYVKYFRAWQKARKEKAKVIDEPVDERLVKEQQPKLRTFASLDDDELNDIDLLAGIVKQYQGAFENPKDNKDYVKFVNRVKRMKKDSESRERKDSYAAEQAEFVCEMLDPHFRIGFGQEGTKTMVEIVSERRKLVKDVGTKEAMFDKVKQKIADISRSKGNILEPSMVKELAEYWMLYGAKIPTDLVTYAGFDTELWAYGRPKILPKGGVMPTWEKFLARMNDPEAFAAWVYGVASKRYSGRQILWLHGENGEDGKSFIQKRIVEQLFEHVNAPMQNSALHAGADRFLQADFENKTIAYWDDCNNPMALGREDIKQLSAGAEGQEARVEKKGKQAYKAQLETRMWINSNFAPIVTGENFIQSRLLYIHLAPLDEAPDHKLKDKFVSEMPAFLHFAQMCYQRVCSDDRKIEQSEEAKEAIEQLQRDHEEEFVSIFDDHFRVVVDSAGKPSKKQFLKCSEISQVLKQEKITYNPKIGQFYRWMERVHQLKKVVEIVEGEGKQKIAVVYGLAGKDDLRVFLKKKR